MPNAGGDPKKSPHVDLRDLSEDDFSIDEALDVWSKMADDSPPPPPEPAED
jgi:hypothetical protein